MYENGITVTYRLHREDPPYGLTDPEQVYLPGWAAGDTQMAVTLYLFGSRGDSYRVDVVDWTEVDPEPKPLHGAGVKVGDLVTWRGINGHTFEGYVQELWSDGTAKGPGINDNWHSGRCGCVQEPWEYDPLDAY